MSAGYDHCVCVDSEGHVWSWGAKGHTPRNTLRVGNGPQEEAGEGAAAPALMAARLVGGGQLGRRVNAAADALEPLPAARAELIGCRVAHVAAGWRFEIKMAPLPLVKATTESPSWCLRACLLTLDRSPARPEASGGPMPPSSYVRPPRRELSALDQ